MKVHVMNVTARVENSLNNHKAVVQTNGLEKSAAIAPKPEGYGSSLNGGELLFLALATCFCNDIYREAEKKNITITKVFVEVTGEFGAAGEPGYNITYKAKLEGDASQEELAALIRRTDNVAEIQNTLRAGVNVKLVEE